MYLKITNFEENHHGLQYHDGLNIDPVPFRQVGSCCPGGIYFTTQKYICKFIGIGVYVREVTIPEDAEMRMDPSGGKWRASAVILGERRDLGEAGTWKWLVENGVDIHTDDDYALKYAAEYGHLELVKCLVGLGANINSQDGFALRYASDNGHLGVVKYLIEAGADIHAGVDGALRVASANGHLEVIKCLIEAGADIHAGDALEYASSRGHVKVVNYLKQIII